MYKVLIVEDEDIICKGLTFMMNWQKVNCIIAGEASDGQEGLDKILDLKPDIVITDIRMPVMNGLQMLENAKKEENFASIILSGYNDFDYAQKGIRLGVDDYLLKPVDFNKLEESIIKIQSKLNLNSNNNLENLDKELLDTKVFLNINSRRVRALLNEIKNNYSKKLYLKELATKYDMTPNYLNSKFKKNTGYTFNDFLNRYRIMKANELIQNEPQLKIYEVAEKVGFSDYRYFIKVYKKYIGYPPLQMHHHFEN